MLNHLLPQLVSSSSPPRPLLLSCFAFSLRSLLPSYTLFILTSVMFFPFTPVFLQILPFLSQETMNLPFLPILSSPPDIDCLLNKILTGQRRRDVFKKNRISHFKFRCKTRTENLHHPSCCGLVLREPKQDCNTQTAALRTSPPPNMADAVSDVVRRHVPWTSTQTSHSSPWRSRAHGNRQPNVERAAVNEV